MSNSKSWKNYLFLTSILLYAIIFFLIIVPKYPNQSLTISGIFTCIITVVAYFQYGFQNYNINSIRKKIITTVLVALIIYFTIIFTLGIFTGYLHNSYSLKPMQILKHVSIPLISAVALEFFRYIFISANKDKKSWIILSTVMITLLDIIINYVKVGDSLVQIFVYLSVIVLPIIFRNALLSYITYQTGYEACILYIIPITLYKFFVPVLPDLGNYLTCVVNITLPSMIFIYIARMINDFLNDNESSVKIVKVLLLDIPLVIIFTILVGLVSGYFSYHLVGVEESNLGPKINRGDAVMLYRNIKEKDLHVGDIIAYRTTEKIIIDRIANIKEEKGEINYYFVTQKNEGEEDSYRIMHIEDIMGKYKFRISKIAWPTIKFKEFIQGDVNEN